jgi:hypothetical protein
MAKNRKFLGAILPRLHVLAVKTNRNLFSARKLGRSRMRLRPIPDV